jgi:hypothetical protein
MFGLAALPCLALGFFLGPESPTSHRYFQSLQGTKSPVQAVHYAVEKPAAKTSKVPRAGPKVELTPTLEERRDANTKELQRLRTWSEALRLKKRDLLRSDKAGNVAHEAELARYNADLAKANAERTVLWPTAP